MTTPSSTVLVVDTALAACQVGLFEGARLVVGASEPMERGHQERLAPMAAELLAGRGMADVRKIVVTMGPGSFTGLRVGLAFAKGLAFASGATLAGVGTLAALAAGRTGAAASVIDARRGLVYVQAFVDGAPQAEPDIITIDEAAQRLAPLADLTLVGPGAGLLAAALPKARVETRAAPDLAALGPLAEQSAPDPALRPLYLRAPDARPSSP